MTKSPYIREGLWATEAQATDPEAELEAWLFESRALLRQIASAPRHEPACFSLIASYGRFRRVRMELLEQEEMRRLLHELNERVDAGGADWVKLALKVPNPPAWLNDVDVLESSFDELENPLAQAEAASNLIEDLDDVDLLCWFARNLGVRDPRLERELEECHFRLAVQPDTFLPASVYVQAIGKLLRPDLVEFDPELAMTAQKFIVLLDAFVGAERDIALVGQPALPADVLKHLHDVRSERQHTIHLSTLRGDWPWEDIPVPGPLDVPALAAADDSDVDVIRRRHATPSMSYAGIDWLGPGRLLLVYDGHTISLLFYTETDNPPPELQISEPDRPRRQVDWKPSPVRDRLYRSVIGTAGGTLVIRAASDPHKKITIVE